MLLDAAARSLKVHGFTDILFIGDSGGNQAGISTVANKLNEEWKDTGVRCSRSPIITSEPRVLPRVAAGGFGYDEETAGSHAGITDTSQMLFIHPAGSARTRSSRGAVRRTRRLGRSARRPRRLARWASSSR